MIYYCNTICRNGQENLSVIRGCWRKTVLLSVLCTKFILLCNFSHLLFTNRDKYGISKFYDEYDTCIIRECMVIDTKEKMLEKITKFYNYVMEISGGFDINKFVLRSEVK